MRKIMVLLLGLVALTGIGAAAPYSINLLSPTADTHLTMQGRLSAQQVSAGSSEVAFTYTMRIPDSAPINRSQMDVWRFGAMAANETYTTDIDTVDLDRNATSSGHVVMAPQEEMEQVRNAAPGEMSDRELLDFIDQSPWMSQWASSLCEKAGLEDGTEQYEDCLLAYARDALGE